MLKVRETAAGALSAREISSALAAYAARGGWYDAASLLARARSRGEPLEGAAVQRAIALCARGGEWRLLLKLFDAPCAAAASAVAPAAAAAATHSAGGGGGEWVWSSRTWYTALKASKRLGDWRAGRSLLQRFDATAAAAAAEGDDGGGGGGDAASLDAGAFQVVMATCLASGDPAALRCAREELMPQAEARGLGRGDVYGAAMQASVVLGDPDAAWALHRRAREKGVPLFAPELNIALGAGARCGKLRDALALLDEMRAARDGGGGALAGGGGRAAAGGGLSGGGLAAPDVGSYDAVLKPLMMERRDDEMLRRFEQMGAEGLRPLESHFRLAISACANLRQGGRAAALLLRMQQDGLRYQDAAADAMSACCREGHPDLALDIFESVRREVPASAAAADARGADSIFVMNSALEALRRRRSAAEAAELLGTMGHGGGGGAVAGGVAPDERSFAVVLAACREAAQWDALPGVLATLAAACSRDAAAAPPLLRSERVHAELIAAFGRLGEPHRSVALLRQLLASNLPLTQRPFDATLAALGPRGLHGGAGGALEVLRAGLERGVWGDDPLGWRGGGGGGDGVLDLSRFRSRPPSSPPPTSGWRRSPAARATLRPPPPPRPALCGSSLPTARVREGGAGAEAGAAHRRLSWVAAVLARLRVPFDTDGGGGGGGGGHALRLLDGARSPHIAFGAFGPGIDLAPAAATRRPGASGHASLSDADRYDSVLHSGLSPLPAAAATACRRPPSPTTTAGPTAAAATAAATATAAVLGVWPICRRLSATRSTLSSTYCLRASPTPPRGTSTAAATPPPPRATPRAPPPPPRRRGRVGRRAGRPQRGARRPPTRRRRRAAARQPGEGGGVGAAALSLVLL